MRNHGRINWAALPGMLGLVVVLAGSAAAAEVEAGRVAVVNGEVRITKDAGLAAKDAGRVAKPNDSIYNTDVVRTGNGAAAKLLFTDQSVMDLGPNTALKVSDYALKDGQNRTATFSLVFGKLRALVTKKVSENGKVEVRSSDAVMGVRGTEFLVDSNAGLAAGQGGATGIVVVSGMVLVTPPLGGPPVMVGAGQMFVASPKTFAQATSGGGSDAKQDKKDDKKDDKKEAKQEDKKGDDAKKADAKGEAGGASGNAATPKGSGPVVTQVNPEQMQNLMNNVKTEDHTFLGAITIAPVAGGGGAPSFAITNIGSLIAAVAPPPPASETGGVPRQALPDFLQNNNTNFLPPVNIIPGNIVHLSVSVQ